MNYKIAQLALYNPHHSRKSGELLIEQPTEQNPNGLLILLETETNTQNDLQFIQTFLEIAYGAYEQSLFHEAEKTLENILGALNDHLPGLSPKNYDWQNHFSCFIGLTLSAKIYFSSYGKIKTYLIKPTLIKNLNSPAEPEDLKKNQLFDYTLSGELKAPDRFLVAGETVTDYLSLEKIKKIITTLPPISAVAHLTNILEAAPPSVSFFAIILEAVPAARSATNPALNPDIKAKTASSLSSKRSLDQMLKTQAETEKILKPPSLIDLVKNRFKEKPQLNTGEAATKVPPEATIKFKTRRPKGLIESTAKLKKPLLWILKNSLHYLKICWEFLVIKEKHQAASDWLANLLEQAIKKFTALPKTHKIAVVTGLVLLLFFSQSLIWQGQRTAALKAAQAYGQALDEFNNQKSALEASLIYHDTVRAKEILKAMDLLVKGLPQDSKDQLKKQAELAKTYQELFNQAWQITNIIEPLTLIDFQEISAGATINSLLLKNSYLYGLGVANKILAAHTQTAKALVMDSLNLELKTGAVLEKSDKLILATPDKKFFALENDHLKPVTINLPAELKQLDDLDFFGSFMYVLDQSAKQIFRLTNYGDSFSAPRLWLKQNLAVDQIASLAVDGFIYALTKDGDILKLAGGLQQEFPAILMEPELKAPTKIYTQDTSDNLYILDPQNKRFLAVSKEGELKKQYYSDKFNNLKDLIVKEKEKKAYLLNGSKVYVIALP